MASIMKRGDSYSVRYKYKDHSGKPCEGWESFKTRKEAQERKITVEKELLDGSFLVPDTMTVEEMLYKWIPIQSTKHKWSPKTYTQSVAMVQNLIVPYIGKWKVQELRTYDIEKFYATLAKTPCGQYVHGIKQTLTDKQKKRLLSSTSIHEVHTLLKTAFSYAVEWDLIHKIPLPRDAPKVNIEERTIWDEKTMLAALQTIENPALHLAVHMSMILSLREGEFSACSRVIWISMPPMGVAPSRSTKSCREPIRTLWKSSIPIRSTTPSQTDVRAASPPSS